MPHPDKHLVGLLGVGMAALGMVTGLVLVVLLCLHAHRVLPRRRSRGVYWIGMVVLVPLTLVAAMLTPLALRTGAVIASFGWDAYAEGLHVVNKHGQLSDGAYLSVFWAAALGAWILPIWLILSLPVVAWHRHFRAPREEPG